MNPIEKLIVASNQAHQQLVHAVAQRRYSEAESLAKQLQAMSKEAAALGPLSVRYADGRTEDVHYISHDGIQCATHWMSIDSLVRIQKGTVITRPFTEVTK